MADLAVIVPSRGRPEATRGLAQAFRDTCTADTVLVLAVDESDPRRDDYEALPPQTVVLVTPATTMVDALNRAAVQLCDGYRALGFMGDDHLPRTHGWDATYLEALANLGTGIVYGNDGLQGENLPTQCAMTADIVRALGYMAPPALTHLFVDNFWLVLGREVGVRYLPDVLVEHRHPLAGKAAWDAGYARVNSSHMYVRDEAAFRQYVATSFAGDVAKVRGNAV